MGVEFHEVGFLEEGGIGFVSFLVALSFLFLPFFFFFLGYLQLVFSHTETVHFQNCKQRTKDERKKKRKKTTHSTPELRIIPFGDHRPLTIRPQSRSDEIESRNQFLAIGRVQSVFGAFAHCDDEDVAMVAVEG
jgi:hypothetical protein